MNLLTLQSLISNLGQDALGVAASLNPTEESFLPCLTKLQKQFDSDLAKAALETVILRRKAQTKFSRADSMFFTRAGLEMASGEIISRYRAKRFAHFEHVADLCCGIGGDSIGLGLRNPTSPTLGEVGDFALHAIDSDPLHLALAKLNLAAYNAHADFVQSDLTQDKPPRADAYFFDPSRRAAHKRIFSVKDYQPPLSLSDSLLPKPAAVKISPGVKMSEIDHYDCEVEFISVEGELKECVLWFWFAETFRRNISTLLRPDHDPLHLTEDLSLVSPVSISSPLQYLYELDPSVLRSGLVTTLARQIDAQQIDADISYLTSARKTATPWARRFFIEAALPFSQKRLREKLRSMNVGRVTIKKRGSPLDVDEFARSLKLKGDEERIIFLTHVKGEAWVLIGKNDLN
ncbi:MAG: SAM-dependent methyltransferase [Chloroflexi bacterium]|nr:SAM-dependent methyltransferase [Chloroflexota bacterium]